MNGIHDMGGMQDMGSIEHEKNEPVFHARWEARFFALRQAVTRWGKWNIDASRYQGTLIPPADYLRMSYYEKQMVALLPMLVQSGLVAQTEIDRGKRDKASTKTTPRLTANQVADVIAKGVPAKRDVVVAAQFKAGQAVRARNINPETHTRLPRYARGKAGTVMRDYGVFVFPDTNAHFLGENPQHLYSVRFTARELWGGRAPAADAVYIDLWDDYLEPV